MDGRDGNLYPLPSVKPEQGPQPPTVLAEQAEFDAFVRAEFGRLTRYAYRHTRDRYIAEDYVQEALMRTAPHWATARANPDAYIRRVIINIARDHARAAAARPQETAFNEQPEDGRASADPVDAVADVQMIQAGLAQLPPGKRTVLVLRYLHDMSVEDTAQIMGCSTGTVKSQTAKALTALRTALEQVQTTQARPGTR